MLRKVLVVMSGAVVSVMVFAGAAFAQTDPSTIVGAGASDIKDELLQTGAAVIPYAALVLGLFLAWKVGKRFLRS